MPGAYEALSKQWPSALLCLHLARLALFHLHNSPTRQVFGPPFYQGPERCGHESKATQLPVAKRDSKPGST